jgi:shikimate kinase
MNNSIVLMGLKHCGKTTQGKLLAEHFSVPFFDTDDVLEQIVGTSFRKYYADKGPAAFSLAEEQACNKIVTEHPDDRIVVATGGGICDNAPALNELRQLGKFVFLCIDIEYSVSRIMAKVKQDVFGKFEGAPAWVMKENPKNLHDVKEILINRFKERNEQYKNIADVMIAIKNAPIQDNFKTILGAI